MPPLPRSGPVIAVRAPVLDVRFPTAPLPRINEARVAAMVAAKGNIERVRTGLEARERQTRQEEITAEVAELAGAMLTA